MKADAKKKGKKEEEKKKEEDKKEDDEEPIESPHVYTYHNMTKTLKDFSLTIH